MTNTREFKDLKIEIYADGADLEAILELAKLDHIKGITTNPSLMKKAGITDYEGFCKTVLEKVTDLPISFEVFEDTIPGMLEQAKKIATWGNNVFVKIPVSNTKGEKTLSIIKELSGAGVKLNVTANFTKEQIKEVCEALNPDVEALVSVFAGRIADTGVDPIPFMEYTNELCKGTKLKSLWASTRETFNIFEADRCGTDVITVPNNILGKLDICGKSLEEYSLDTVKGFYKDATSAGFSL